MGFRISRGRLRNGHSPPIWAIFGLDTPGRLLYGVFGEMAVGAGESFDFFRVGL